MEENKKRIMGSKNIPVFHEDPAVARKKKRKKRFRIFMLCFVGMLLIGGVAFYMMGYGNQDPTHNHSYVAHMTAPTCKEEGFTTYICECGESYTADVVAVLDHTPGEEATCTEGQICTVCNTELKAALGHKRGGGATCTEPSDCAVCGERLESASGHIPGEEATCTEGQICTVCNTELKAALGHTPGEWEIIKNATETETGLKVKNCSFCGEKTNEESITASLGLDFGSNSDGTYCVSGIGSCKDTDLVIPSEHNGVPVTGIGAFAFENNASLTSILLPDSVTDIGECAFFHCSGLKSIEFPDSLTTIGSLAFADCSGLTDIVIPDSVITMDSHAFFQCTGLKNVVIGNGLADISNYAFSSCSALTGVVIGSNVTNIGDSAFYNCKKLKSIQFAGTTAEWNAMSKGSSWNSSASEVICSDGTVSLK